MRGVRGLPVGQVRTNETAERLQLVQGELPGAQHVRVRDRSGKGLLATSISILYFYFVFLF